MSSPELVFTRCSWLFKCEMDFWAKALKRESFSNWQGDMLGPCMLIFIHILHTAVGECMTSSHGLKTKACCQSMENLSWELPAAKWAVVYPVQILPNSLYKKMHLLTSNFLFLNLYIWMFWSYLAALLSLNYFSMVQVEQKNNCRKTWYNTKLIDNVTLQKGSHCELTIA